MACAVISFVLLTLGLRDLPVGTAYAIWTGIGAVGPAVVRVIWFKNPATVVRIASILLIVRIQLHGPGQRCSSGGDAPPPH